MKRVRIAPGKHTVISAELAEKAAQVFGAGLPRDVVRDLARLDVSSGPVVMAGKSKPLALSNRGAPNKKPSGGA